MADFTSHLINFIKIYEKGEQNLHPKFKNNNKYIASIREFLATCDNSTGRDFIYKLTDKLESFI